MTLTTVARYDKNMPYGNTFVAPLAVDFDERLANQVIGVGLNASGQVVVGSGQTGIRGILIVPLGKNVVTGDVLEGPIAGDNVDVMKIGEVTNFRLLNVTTFALTAAAAGTNYFATPTGQITATAVDGSVLIGHTIEADATQGARLHVFVSPTPIALDVP